MSQRRLSLSVAVLALVAIAAFPTAAFAQQAAAYSNPLDSGSDISAWYGYGYPNQWAVDDTPIDGHSGAGSLNLNNGTDIDNFDYWFYGYFDIDSQSLDLAGLDSPSLSFWCRWDLPTFADYQDRYITMFDPNDYDPYLVLYFPADLDCGAADQWHQHIIPFNPSLLDAPFIIEFYIYYDWWSSGQSAAGYEGWFIDDLQVLVPDVTPPAAIADLAASNATLTEIQVDWSAPFDDDVSGVTASFDLRYSTTAITGTNFSSATPVNGEPTPDVEGTPHSLLVTGLTEATTYFFAIQTTDIAGNVSTISNVATLATLTPPPPPPPPAAAKGPSGPDEPPDDILPCSAGTTAAPTGMMALAGLIALAFAVRRK